LEQRWPELKSTTKQLIEYLLAYRSPYPIFNGKINAIYGPYIRKHPEFLGTMDAGPAIFIIRPNRV
jgi:hypothetical protein